MPKLDLLTFRRSHYNEKARWALDYKGLAHTRTYLMPGPHAQKLLKIVPETTTPVLLIDGEPLQGSDRILEALEDLKPDPPLFPADLKDEMAEVMRFFDEDLGPAIRRCAFTTFIDNGRYLTSIFVDKATKPEQLIYRMVLPLVRPRIAAQMGIRDEPLVEQSYKVVDTALDLIAEKTAATGYLVGDRFTAADLTAAALMGPGIRITHPDMALPQPEPEPVREARDKWMAHPASQWVLAMYDKHRPAPLA